MVFPHIEKIKQEYTDKYVMVDPRRPELARFRDIVGQVKTVNMNGQALVEFLDYHLNIGWYDIDLDYLKVVDKPKPKEKEAKKPAAKKAAPKPAAKPAAEGEKKLSPLEMARMQGASGGAAKPAAAKSEKKSTEDILAAARGGAAPAKEKPEKKTTEDILAAARGGAAPAQTETAQTETAQQKSAPPQQEDEPTTPAASGGKVDRSKMSVADMLAAARGAGSDATQATKEEETPPSAATAETPPPAEAEPAPETSTEEPAAEEKAGGVVKVDKSKMSVDEIIAYCREHDAE